MVVPSDADGTGEVDPAHAAVVAATERVGLTALRIGLVLLVAVTAGDTALAAANGTSAPVLAIGVLIALLALIGVAFPRAAARLLTAKGRVLLLAALLAILGLLVPGLRAHYSDVEFGLACVAAIVASPVWVLAFVGASALGALGDELAVGHSLSWALAGRGQGELLTQLSIMLAGAAVWVGVIWVLRHSISSAPTNLERVRRGAARSLTPRLEAAVRGDPAGLLMRASAAAVVDPLSAAEARVLSLLASGLAPKQVAHRLGVAMPTVRTHIAAAKRKTGARTLEQLVGLFVEARHGG